MARTIVRFSIITAIIITFYLYLFYLFMEWNQLMEARPNDSLMNLDALVEKNIISPEWINNNYNLISKVIVKPYVNYHYRYSKFWMIYYQALL